MRSIDTYIIILRDNRAFTIIYKTQPPNEVGLKQFIKLFLQIHQYFHKWHKIINDLNVYNRTDVQFNGLHNTYPN